MRSRIVFAGRYITAFLLALTIGFTASAKFYYVSNAGNDNNNGLTTSTPWKTLTKVSSFTGFVGGDEILFNRGEVFYGQLVMNSSGSSDNPIIISAYGTGADPIISGFTTVEGWTSLGSNVWESTNAVSTLPATNMVVINGVNTPMGRYPNTGYLTYQSFSGKTGITSSSLSGSPNWTGAEVVIRKQRWIIDRNRITAQSGGTLTYSSSSTYNGQAGYGFFIQNDSRTLDQQNEWYYNPSTRKIRVYSAATPGKVQVASKDTLVTIKYRDYITFDNISFQGSNKDAFVILSSSNITIQNCSIDFSGNDAIWGNQNWGKPSSSFVLRNSSINHTNNNGMYLNSEFAGALISHNTFKNTGMIVGMGGSGEGTYEALQTRANNAIIEYNEIDSVGYVGIGFHNDNTIVRNNFVNGFCFVKLDGAGIYTWIGTGNTPYKNQKVLNNIVMNGFGDNSGTTATGNPISHGIYMDDWSANVEVAGNSVANCPHSGIYLHKAHDLNVHNNTSFNNNQYQLLMVSSELASPIRNDIVKNNIFVSKTATQLVGGFQSIISDVASFGTIDSNYYARPISDNIIFNIIINNYAEVYNYNLAQWQGYAGFDAHSHKSPKTITTVNDLRFEYNASTVNKTISLDGNYIDVKNVSYNGQITLAPYTSAVLIRNGPATNQVPVANAGANQVITLPTSSVSLSGTGTDPNGTISAYAWTKISGPVSGSITTATAAATNVTALVQGIYLFQLKVTDNAGAIDMDTVQVTVNSSNIPPVANAGGDQIVTTTTATLNGSGTDADGTIASYTWTKVSGPAVTIVSPNTATTALMGLVEGTYQFQLKITDNKGASAIDVILLTMNVDDDLLPAVNPANTVNGLNYTYYESAGGWSILPNFSTSTPAKSGTSANFDLSLADKTVAFSFNFTGFINVPADGKYTFYTTSDDGSNLYIDNILVVNNDGQHGAVEKSGTIGLKAGKHVISVGYFQQGGGSTLSVSYSGTGVSKQPIPASSLFRIMSDALLPAVNPANTVNGLDYKYYESGGGWPVLPVFSALIPVKTGTAPTFDISLSNRLITFSFNFTGFITVPADGQYTFYTTSDDGSKLLIDNVPVVNNDGLHGVIEKSGTIGLKAGKHAISVGYLQQGGSSALSVSYSGPGVIKTIIPPTALYRINPQARDNTLSMSGLNGDPSLPAPPIGVTAYPNPFGSYIKVNVNGGVAGQYKLSLVNAAGKTVWTTNGVKNAANLQHTINTSTLERGIYFLKVIQNNVVSVIKLAK